MVGRNTSKTTLKAARATNNKQVEDCHAASRGELSQIDIIKKQADQIVEFPMANREMMERYVRMKQRLDQAEPRFGNQREVLTLQRPTVYANGSKRLMGEPPAPRISVFERVGQPMKATSNLVNRALSVASSSNNLRPLAPYRRSASQRVQHGGFHQDIREDQQRNSWARPEGKQSWQEADLAPRWREDEWIEPPRQPLRDRHLEVEELVHLPRNLRPKPKVEYRLDNPRPIVPVQGRGLREEVRVRLSSSLLTERVLAIIFLDSWRAPKMPKFEGNTDPIIYLVEF